MPKVGARPGADLEQLPGRARRRNQIRLSSQRPTRSPSPVGADRRTPGGEHGGDQLAGQRTQALRVTGQGRPDRPRVRRRHRASLLRRISRPAAESALRRADTTRKSGDLPGTAVTVTLWRAVPLRRAGDAARRRAVPRTVVPASRRRRPGDAGRRRTTPARPAPAAYVGRAVGALWMGLAHGVGWAVRAAGRQAASARDLDPEHRRDGAGLLLFGLAILSAVAHLVLRRRSGRRAARRHGTALPRRDLGRGAGAADDRRLAADAPARPTRSTGARPGRLGFHAGRHRRRCCTSARTRSTRCERDYAGGLVGAGVGDLLERAVTAWVAVPLLVLLLRLRSAGGHRDPDQQDPGAARPARRRAGRPRRTPPTPRRTRRDGGGRPSRPAAGPAKRRAAAGRPGRRSTTSARRRTSRRPSCCRARRRPRCRPAASRPSRRSTRPRRPGPSSSR